MNKIVIAITVAVLAIGGFYAATFYKKNLTGVGPAIQNPPGDITKPAEPKDNLGLTLPKGFSIAVFAKDLTGPRVMLRDPIGNILVSQPSAGNIVALASNDSGNVSQKKVVVASALTSLTAWHLTALRKFVNSI